jgi:hypothetical protein
LTRTLARVFGLILLGVITAVLAVGCGDDDDDQTAAADLERFCALSEELDRAGADAFRELEQDPDATPEDFEAAERELVESHEAQIDELQEVAPPEIAEDARTLAEALRARAGLGAKVDEGEAEAAEQRVQRFEKQNC